MDEQRARVLEDVAGRATPSYAYFLDEVARALNAGCPPARITFSGPAKRDHELAFAVDVDCGLFVCESMHEMRRLDEIARLRGKQVAIAIRINPSRVPKQFGVAMAGKPSQFGIDEEDLPLLVADVRPLTHLRLAGFHIYSGTNSLSEEALVANFTIFCELFERFATLFGIEPETLIFGSGFGIPYYPDERPLELSALLPSLTPLLATLRAQPAMRQTRMALEIGRFLVGPPGFFLTRVVTLKKSRGVDICLCDGGFNNHLAAFGMMGSVIRRNWNIWNISRRPGQSRRKYTLVGPLCTTIDTLAQDVELDEVAVGDVLAVGASGAYGPTASPVNFISHPMPREFMVRASSASCRIEDVSELADASATAMATGGPA
jgi:diaminopimelate decarboxylase